MKMMKASKKIQVQCDAEVKELFRRYSHQKCTCANRRKYSVAVSGKLLNDYLLQHRDSSTDPSRFNTRKKYSICTNLHDAISKANIKEEEQGTPSISVEPITITDGIRGGRRPQRKCLQQPPTAPTITTTNNDNISHSQRLFFLRNRISVDDATLKGVKKVSISVENERHEIDTTKLRVDQKKKFTNDVLSHYYKLPFGKITMRVRRNRMADIGKIVIAACVNRKEFKKDSDAYLHKNKEVVLDVLNLLDGIKEYIMSKSKVNIHELESVAVIPPESDSQGLIHNLNEKERAHKLAISLLGQTTRRGYEQVRHSMDEFIKIPSFHNITKKLRPKIVPFTINDNGPTPVDGSNDSTPAPVLNFEEMQFPEEYQLDLAMRRISQQKELFAAKIDGGYDAVVSNMQRKHISRGRVVEGGDGGNVVIIDSIDGAEHLKSKKDITSVISFSSTMYAPQWVQSKTVTGGSSLNILTWQQVRGTESLYTMMPAVGEYFETKRNFREERKREEDAGTVAGKYNLYDLHDGKMLYLLTQHSQWNRKYKPFLLCKCGRGEGVPKEKEMGDNEEDQEVQHECIKISHEDHIRFFERSQRRWDLKTAQDPTYNVKKHMDGTDKNNEGLSHFGLHPSLLPRDGIRFDTFHLKCSVTRKLMTHLRLFLLNQATEVINLFQDTVLKVFWKDFHLYVWQNKKNFSSFLGNEIALFVANFELIVTFLEENIVITKEVEHIQRGLQLWRDIFKFLGVTYLEEGNDYLKLMDQFEADVKEFYDVGSTTFLSTPGTTDGQEETFYCHTLRYYIPEIAQTTFERHSLGVGIFNMQGFEQRNKELKYCMSNYSNNKGNTLPNNLRRLSDIFFHEINAT